MARGAATRHKDGQEVLYLPDRGPPNQPDLGRANQIVLGCLLELERKRRATPRIRNSLNGLKWLKVEGDTKVISYPFDPVARLSVSDIGRLEKNQRRFVGGDFSLQCRPPSPVAGVMLDVYLAQYHHEFYKQMMRVHPEVQPWQHTLEAAIDKTLRLPDVKFERDPARLHGLKR